MLQVEDIKNYCTNYKVENGKVIDKNTNQQVLDENTILKVKSSVLIYLNANKIHKDDLHLNRKVTKTQETCILKSMEQYSVNNEKTNIGINKLINALTECNGHYEEFISGNNLEEHKYSMFSEKNRDYGVAFLKLKFREKGLDISDFTINLQKDILQNGHETGQYKVIIDFKIKKYNKIIQNQQNTTQVNIQHPRANELNELENQKQIAKQNNDEIAYNYAQENINKILKENPLNISETEYNAMNKEDKIRYINLKMKEAKALNDQDLFNYWNANLKRLESIKTDNTTIQEYHAPLYNNPLSNNIEIIKSNTSVKTEEKDYKYYYQELMKQIERRRASSQITESEKKEIIGNIAYNQGYMIKTLKNENEYSELLTNIVNNLSRDKFEINLQNNIVDEILAKINKEKKEIKNDDSKIEDNHQSKVTNQSDKINVLKQQIKNISKAYNLMNSDKKIDIDELYVLIKKIDKLDDIALSLKLNASSESEKQILNDIIDLINTEKQKMINMQKKVENITSGFTM